MYKKTSPVYLESQAKELAKQFRQAITDGEIFKNVKKIYRKLKKVQKQITVQPGAEEGCRPL